MSQPKGFIASGKEELVCKLRKSIYGLKQASRSWNICFDLAVQGYGFEQNMDEPCVYKRMDGKAVVYLILYVDDILLIGNDVAVLSTIKVWLSSQFDIKDLGEANYVLGIKITRDRRNMILSLSQRAYIDKLMVRFSMTDSKKGYQPFRYGVVLTHD